ncbi:hypothetical protein JKF63_05499 [Porcisia hertigi]|uniref:3-oxo-5-alpha-steroid 4-dehydrogenase C-terminal domain-containing protein n=1 Tax=Porcisia hertigi TaxID=2761500 RepID=A0A836IYI5_9TRYP|nr:hypothetical protein JKF63_05499 [Porcisia hertigi]
MYGYARTATVVVVHLAFTCVLLGYIADTAMPFYVHRKHSNYPPGVNDASSFTTAVHRWDRWPLFLVSNKEAYAAQLAQHHHATSASDVVALNARVVWRSSVFHLTLAVITYVLLTYCITAPYGRHAGFTGGRLRLPSRVSWMLQESPTIFQVLYHVLLEYPRVMGHSPSLSSPWFSFSANLRAAGVADTNPSMGVCQSYWGCVRVACTQQHLGLLLFVIHYIHRSWFYPLSIPASAHRVPLLVTSTATLYCLFNGRLQVLASAGAAVDVCATGATAQSPACSAAHVPSMSFLRCWRQRYELESPRASSLEAIAVDVGWCLLLGFYVVGVCGGLALFFFGARVNMQSDYYLVGLRGDGKKKSNDDVKEPVASSSEARLVGGAPLPSWTKFSGIVKNHTSGSGYRIPVGGWFDSVSCANFFGELIEWTGYAMVVTATSATCDGNCRSVTTALDEEVLRSLSSSSSFWSLMNVMMWIRLTARVFFSAAASRSAALAAFSFLVYVFSNLAPRAAAHHAWYAKTFGERYTKLRRKALLPGVY